MCVIVEWYDRVKYFNFMCDIVTCFFNTLQDLSYIFVQFSNESPAITFLQFQGAIS